MGRYMNKSGLLCNLLSVCIKSSESPVGDTIGTVGRSARYHRRVHRRQDI